MFVLVVHGGSTKPVGKATPANYRKPRGLQNRVKISPDESVLGDKVDGQHRLASVTGGKYMWFRLYFSL